MIYQPSEDSYLLSDTIKEFLKDKINNKDKNIKILDMGTGSGIQAKTCKELGFKDILCIDINSEAVKELEKQKFRAIKSNLFSIINKNKKFDLITFNPPYLPEDKRETKESQINTTAGKKGYEIIIKFLKQAKDYLSDDGTILLLFSSLSQPKIILDKARKLGYKYKLLNKQKISFEELFVYEFKK